MSKQETSRKLTMEEKRKLEKVIFADIETAEDKYNSTRKAKREELEEKCIKNAPQRAKALVKQYIDAIKARDKAEEELETMGYEISTSYHDDQATLKLPYSHKEQPKAIQEFDKETKERREGLSELKRSYTIKLFAGGAEAQELFKALAKELKELTK